LITLLGETYLCNLLVLDFHVDDELDVMMLASGNSGFIGIPGHAYLRNVLVFIVDCLDQLLLDVGRVVALAVLRGVDGRVSRFWELESVSAAQRLSACVDVR
jgi:hypothetical protein